MPSDVDFIRKQVERSRSKLLDTSKRNNLISFNHRGNSRQHIRVIDALPDFLYGAFQDGKTLDFQHLPEEDQIPPDEKTPVFCRHLKQAKLTIEAINSVNEDEEEDVDTLKQIERDIRNKVREKLGMPVWEEHTSLTNKEIAKKYDINPSYEMPKPTPENQGEAERCGDKFIQTLLKREEMDRKLNGLNSYIRSDIQESGVNTLYAVFGFLEWYESENSDKPCFSPLLSLQLEIEKKQSEKGYIYSVRATGEEPEINQSISERLRSDFGINLPEFTREDGPETYMTKVADVIKNKWRVHRFITIGRFRFARFVMYYDLDENRWPGDTGLATNDIVRRLFAGSEKNFDGDHAEDYDIDTPEVEKTVPLLITPADASQHSALVDVMKGKNLAIEGPPGTGKSQTITNIIANALAKDKTVLFLAEKMAALNVVHNRLSKAKLGPYCLELHSTKAKKTEVLNSIKERLRLQSVRDSSAGLKARQLKFKRHRDYIIKYIDVLNSNFGRQDKTIHDYLWACLRKDRIGDLHSTLRRMQIPFEQADLTESELTAHTDKLATIVSLKHDADSESDNGKHPWGFVDDFDMNPFHQGEFKRLIADWAEQLEHVEDALSDFSKRFDLPIEPNAEKLESFLEETEILAEWDVTGLNFDLIAGLGSTEKAEALANFVENVHIYQSALVEIHTLKDVSAAIREIKNIEKQTLAAQELESDNLPASEIKAEVKALGEESDLWRKNLKTLLSIGKRFGVSEKSALNKIYALAEIPDYIASVPRDYLLYRTRDIIDETSAVRLKNAADTQRRIRNLIKEQEMEFDLSMMGAPHEIQVHAAALDNTSFFACLDPSYRQAKKLYTLALKHKRKFNANKAAETLREIAKTKEERRTIEQDAQLQAICGPSFDGLQTDFEKLQKINEWATSVRQGYTAGGEFAHNVREWLFTAEMEELDTVRDLAEDDKFLALKGKIAEIKDVVSPDTPVKEYINSLGNKAEKLSDLKNALQGLTASDDVTFAAIKENLPGLRKAMEAKIAIEQAQSVAPLFGSHYAGTETDIRDVTQTARFLGDCLAVDQLKDRFEQFLCKEFKAHWQEFVDTRTALKKLHEELKNRAEQTQQHSDINLSRLIDAEGWENVPYSDLRRLFKNGLNQPDSLSSWIALNGHLAEAKAAQDIKGELLAVYDVKNLDFETLPGAFEYIIYRTIASEIYRRYPVILRTNGLDLNQARAKLKELDREILELHQNDLCRSLNLAEPLIGNRDGSRKSWTEGPLLEHQISLQRRHAPIRDLMKRAGKSIQNIKPCFLMSPLSVAQYLEPGRLTFDLLVIDEASQMRPEDAWGGVVRSKQIVVVGDPQQLPPTSFFQSAGRDDEDEDEDFTEEAIMTMALSSFRPSRLLSRHYRSQHERLIEFSNYHFYHEKLLLFPSPVKNPDDLGLKLVSVDGTYTSKSTINMDEAEAVVKATLNFMRQHRDRSLGIATMNQRQRDLIEMEMDKAFIENSHAADYRTKWESTLESFFVKNLESVQGDERDAIFISTVYGPDRNGTVMQRFGPINSKVGHRRLNVLFTRAKKNMVVFTSLKPEQIKISGGSSQGVKALKGFLSYASKGVIDEGEETHRDPESDFEIFVKEKLESIGCEVHPQVGVARYRIDLGVKHLRYPYGYLMGVECDGATYHSSRSARERDVIRQQVLEGLGWDIYRIWSTDWFSNQVREFEKLKNYIEGLLRKKDLEAPETDNSVMKHDFKSEEEPEDLFETTEKHDNSTSENVVQLFDKVTYLMVKKRGKKERNEERSVQIVPPSQDNPLAGKHSQHSVIGRELLGAYVGQEIKVPSPVGETTLEVLNIDKYSPTDDAP